MKASFIRETGPPETIQYDDLPDPTPVGNEVLVKTGAVAVNPIDTYIRNGSPLGKLPQTYIVGSDIAGEVVEIGAGVSKFKIGDRVWGSNQGFMGRQGTFAELCSINQGWLYPLPDSVSYEDSAAAALVGLTAHLGLFREAKLQAGESVFVQGGSGGVGSTVVQMAKAVGAAVITTAGSDAKVEICRNLGADHVINYQSEDVAEAIQSLLPQGADVVWETQRQPDMDLLVGALAERGRLIVMAGREARPQFPIGPFYIKEAKMIGFVMFKASQEVQAAAAAGINSMLASDLLHPLIDHVLPLSEAAQAHRLQEESTVGLSGKLSGKLVLTPEPA